jgi:hypothetical protein
VIAIIPFKESAATVEETLSAKVSVKVATATTTLFSAP